MRKLILITTFLLFSSTAQAISVIVKFDDLTMPKGFISPGLSSSILDGYKGFDWNNFGVIDPYPLTVNGLPTNNTNGIVFGSRVGIIDVDSITTSDNSSEFYFNNAYFTGAWDNNVRIEEEEEEEEEEGDKRGIQTIDEKLKKVPAKGEGFPDDGLRKIDKPLYQPVTVVVRESEKESEKEEEKAEPQEYGQRHKPFGIKTISPGLFHIDVFPVTNKQYLVTGFNDGEILYQDTFFVDTYTPFFYEFNYSGIDSLKMSTSVDFSINTNPGYGGSGSNVATGNMQFTTASIPKPSTFILMGIGLVGIVLVACLYLKVFQGARKSAAGSIGSAAGDVVGSSHT